MPFFNFDEHLIIDQYDASVIVKFPDGEMYRFEWDESTQTYTPTTGDNYMQLQRFPDGDEYYYVLTLLNQERHYVNHQGQLFKQKDTNDIDHFKNGKTNHELFLCL